MTAEAVDARGDRPRIARVVGVDVARALAVFGMFAAHVGPDPRQGGADTLLAAADGRASALFALLAGLSLVLMSGSPRTPLTGWDRANAAVVTRVVVRALLLIPLGLWLNDLETGILVILAFYGVFFLLAWPGLWLAARDLALLAAGWAVAGPLVSYLLRAVTDRGDVLWAAPGFDDLSHPGETLTTLLLTGSYPALTWMPFVFAGMAAGRLALDGHHVQRALMAGGAALALLGYGGAWVAGNLLGGLGRLRDVAAPLGVADVLHARVGSVPVTDPAWLTVAEGHTGTPFEIAGATGTGFAVLGLCLTACRGWFGRLLLDPLIAVGAMALTVYTFHIVVIDEWFPIGPPGATWHRLIGFIVTTMLLCWIWRRTMGKGVLEGCMHVLSAAPARLVRGRG